MKDKNIDGWKERLIKGAKDKRIWIAVIIVLAVGAVAVLGNSRLHQNGKTGTENAKRKLRMHDWHDESADYKKDTDSKNDGSGCEEQGEEIEKAGDTDNAENNIAERVIIEDTNYDEYNNKLYAWWFKRNDNHEKSGCQQDFDITQYNAYYTVPVSDKRIYITFDCGYENGFTPDMLDTLKEEGVTAAFFVTQTFIRDNVDIVKRMKEEGHLVCNHTVTHPSMPSKSIEEQKKELITCEEYMREATGYDMDLFFRPPRGEYSERTLKMAQDLGYTTIFWSMAYLDYDVNNQPSAEHVVEHFGKYHHPGAIPLIHNVSRANHDALKSVLELLKSEGYTFGSLNELRK